MITLNQARILVVNDDGIDAPGLECLERVAKQFSDDVWVVAPKYEQSAQSHSLTIKRPLRCQQLRARRFSVDGTPTDCVVMAVHSLMKDRKPNLVLSGVNYGINLGEDVLYSGTIAAAAEATMLGIRSVAFSAQIRSEVLANWSVAEHFLPILLRQLALLEWPTDTFMNVNFPDRPLDDIRGIKVVGQGKRSEGFSVEERVDPRGQSYYWIKGFDSQSSHDKQSDLYAFAEGYVTLSPLKINLTDHTMMPLLKDHMEHVWKNPKQQPKVD